MGLSHILLAEIRLAPVLVCGLISIHIGIHPSPVQTIWSTSHARKAWRMSGELRSELDAVRSETPRQNESSARQALQDLRELRQRYNDMQ